MPLKLWNYLHAVWSSAPPILWYIWAALTLVTLGLLALHSTQWGRNRPLLQYVSLSLLAHLLMVWFALHVTFLGPPGPLGAENGALQVTLVRPLDSASPAGKTEAGEKADTAAPKPWQAVPAPTADVVATPEPLRSPVDFATPLNREPVRAEPPDPEQNKVGTSLSPASTDRPQPSPRPQSPRDDDGPSRQTDRDLAARARHEVTTPDPDGPAPINPSPGEFKPGLPNAQPSRQRLPTDEPRAPLVQAPFREQPEFEIAPSTVIEPAQPKPKPVEPTATKPSHELPKTYERRVVTDRQTVVAQQGGSPDTEAAVKSALAWLAGHQERGGHWDAAKHGADLDRTQTGGNASGTMRPDTGVTGLALLTFLGAGHTHQAGEYQANVQRGIDYLLRMQAAGDGNLSGGASTYAAMYCHGMATLALAEVYGMTGDEKLLPPLRRAVAYSLAAQSPRHGGWRYRPGDAWGDTSQFGWQVMALRAAEMAGLDVPAASRQGMQRYLKHVSSGRHGGLAGYLCIVQNGQVQPADAATPTMTAEALFCRLLLGGAADSAECQEAAAYLLQNLPADGRTDFYYWYYGTMATYQVQGKAWETWNQAVQKRILAAQDRDGSWSPTDRWGGHGGRVFTTALATLTLEVYYRYLPASQPAKAARLRGGRSEGDEERRR